MQFRRIGATVEINSLSGRVPGRSCIGESDGDRCCSLLRLLFIFCVVLWSGSLGLRLFSCWIWNC
jgi:hypothetical protein